MQAKKSYFYSIRFQIILTFGLLTVPVILLIYYLSILHREFDQSLEELTQVESVSNLVQNIERETVDLQRNVLIFKETASESAASKVATLYDSIDDSFTQLTSFTFANAHLKEIEIAENHLKNYKENFDLVIRLRQERAQLISKHLNSPLLDRVGAELDNDQTEFSLADANNILFAHNASMSYLTSYNTDYISSFKTKISRVKASTQNSRPTSTILRYEKNFLRIVAITRHYIFLINVVMAGSANEILYNTRLLKLNYTDLARQKHADTKARLAQQRFWIVTITAFLLIFAILIMVTFYIRLTRPISRITHVFNRLSMGHKTDIPGLDRKDEIGTLASAANVFKQKNELTEKLLTESKLMLDVQNTLNQALAAEKQRAEDALSAKTDFLANMSHELRTPLNSIIGFTKRILKSSQHDEKTLGALNTIKRNGQHLLAMINDILDLSKIEAEKLHLNFTSTNVREICEQCIGQVRLSAEEKGLDIVTQLEPVPLTRTDPDRLSQILLNLLSNAIKYTQEGDIAITLYRTKNDKYITLIIADTGIGISSSDQEKLFKRFEQFDNNSRFKVGSGTGLGLAIVARVSGLLGIDIDLTSEEGQGTTVTLEIPITLQSPPVKH